MSDNYDNFRQWESALKTKKTASRTGTLGVREGKRQFGQLGTTFYKVRRPNRAALVLEGRGGRQTGQRGTRDAGGRWVKRIYKNNSNTAART